MLENPGPRTGYSLLELLIVLAVLAALVAFAQPAIRSSADKASLTGAAAQVQAAISKTRALALREAAPVWFRWQPNGSNWWIERSTPHTTETAAGLTPAGQSLTPPPEMPSDLPPETTTQTSAATPTTITVLRMGTLPAGVRFLDPNQTPNQLPEHTPPTPPLTPPPPNSLPGQDSSELSAAPPQDRLLFSAAGRTSNHTLQLLGQRDFIVELSVRGLTGLARFSKPTRRPQPALLQQEPLPQEPLP
jgi:prepilin-type N-terminal cleavage/methylation domain-containing protein